MDRALVAYARVIASTTAVTSAASITVEREPR
jgi:hypothetical protein